MKWSPAEIERLNPVLQEVLGGLEMLEGDSLLLMGSGEGEMAFRLAEAYPDVWVTGAELDLALVDAARAAAAERKGKGHVQFSPTEKAQLPFYENVFNHLVSESIVFPSPTPNLIYQREMVRVLCPGGQMLLTDVIVPRPVSAEVRKELRKIGIDHLREASAEEFRSGLEAAGLCEVVMKDLSGVLRTVWEERARQDADLDHARGYSLLLQESPVTLGKGLFYIVARGVKPDG